MSAARRGAGLARRGPAAVDADPQIWLDRDIANLPQDRLRRVTVHRAEEPQLVLARPDGAAKLAIAVPADAPAADEVAVDEIARAFEYLTFLDVRPAAEAPGPAIGEARFELADGLTATVATHLEAGNVWIRLHADGGEEAQRLNAHWTGWVYQVGVWKLKAFAPRLEDLKPPPPSSPAAAPKP